MKSFYYVYIYIMALLLYVPFQAHSLDAALSFEIQDGTLTITQGFCPVGMCPQTTARLTGTFNANIAGDTIIFSNIDVNSIPEMGFELPEVPNLDSFGTTRSATFQFDGERLVVNGSIDARAFDGPLYEYEFTALASENLGFITDGYYTARQDFRRCASPMCGGIFIKSVNQRFTRCADGMLRDECYIGTTNWNGLGFDPFYAIDDISPFTPILLQGSVISRVHNGLGDFGEFIAIEAYRPATDNQPQGVFAALINNGIVCITTPCFSIDEYILNTSRIHGISGYDLNPVGASEEDLTVADSLFSENSPLIVAGYNSRQAELYGLGVNFIANQLYLPIRPATQQCPEGYSLTHDECSTPHGCIAPSIELISVGRTTVLDPASDETAENISYSCVESCDSPAYISGPARCITASPLRESSE
jgi:hypothetical protein